MLVSELFESLAQGELSNLAMAEDGEGSIVTGVRPRIIRYANEALLRLYSRFPLKENDVLVQMYESITNYQLIPRFAVNYTPIGSGDNEPIRYLLDLPAEPFQNDLIKILAVYDSTGRFSRPLNDDADGLSVFTPQAGVLQVPVPVDGQTLSVMYQAKHVKLQGDLEELIELPDFLVEAFTSFIAYKVFSHMNTQVSTSKAQEHLTMYESVCTEATDKDLVNISVSTPTSKFRRGGWV